MIIKYYKLISFLLFIVLVVTSFLIYKNDIYSKNNIKSSYVDFKIATGDSERTVISNLYSDKLISSPFMMSIYMDLHNPLFVFDTGIYRIYKGENVPQMISTFKKGSFYKQLDIPSGLRIEEDAALIRNELDVNNKDYKFSVSEYINIAQNDISLFENDYSFMKYIPSGSSLEGFLYPDTYDVPLNITSEQMIKMQLSSFEKNVFEKYRNGLLNNSDGLSLYQTMIIASVVRRETLYDSDKPIVANIFIRRFTSGMALQSDATVQYALGFNQSEGTWWTRNITPSDLEITSPYNTRLYPGLPPTPICSPGSTSINATIHSTPNSYWYFVADSSGHLHYASTLAQQNANISEYL